LRPVSLMCRVASLSRSGFYAWRRRAECRRAIEDRRLLVAVKAIHQQSRQTYGSPRIHAELRSRGILCNLKRIVRLMRRYGIRGIIRRRFVITTKSEHDYPIAPNILNRQFHADDANRVWLTDITYIATDEGWLYLAAVMDLHSRRIVGWAFSRRIDRQLTRDALAMALGRRRPEPGLLHHSDRGRQYACADYQELMIQHDLTGSMSRKGNPYDNAVMESFFRTLKTEAVYTTRLTTREEGKATLVEYIEMFYNQHRRHSALGYLSPAEYERQHGPA
jgi:putative transposase